MPACFPENNAATAVSDTRRSWIKLAGLGAGGGGGGPDNVLELGDGTSFLELGDGTSLFDLG